MKTATVAEIKQRENERLAFVTVRDGLEAAIAFAKQTYRGYRSARRQRPLKYGGAYKKELIVSCVVFRRFIRDNRKQVDLQGEKL
jgi:hypothetical protein